MVRQGCGVSDDLCNEQDLKDVEEAAESADAVLVCAGEPNYTEKPGNINDLLMNSTPVEKRLRITACAQ